MDNASMLEGLKAWLRGEEQPKAPIDYCPHRRSPILGEARTEAEVRAIAAQHRNKFGRIMLNGEPIFSGVYWTQLGDGERYVDANGRIQTSFTY